MTQKCSYTWILSQVWTDCTDDPQGVGIRGGDLSGNRKVDAEGEREPDPCRRQARGRDTQTVLWLDRAKQERLWTRWIERARSAGNWHDTRRSILTHSVWAMKYGDRVSLTMFCREPRVRERSKSHKTESSLHDCRRSTWLRKR